MNMMTFAQRMKLQQSELSLASGATTTSRSSPASSGLESTTNPAASCSTQPPSLQQGPRQQATYVPGAGLASTHGSILTSGPFDAKKALAGMSLESLFGEEDNDEAAFDDWVSPLPEDCELIYEKGLGRPLYQYREPPCPTRAYFPGDPFALDHGRPKTLPYDSVGPESVAEPQRKTNPSPSAKPVAKIDPFANRTIYIDYPHVFRPKPKPTPPAKSHERSCAGEAFDEVLKGIKSKVKSFAASRTRSNVRKSAIGMSMCINGSTHNFAASTNAVANGLHSLVNANEIHQATAKAPKGVGHASGPPNSRKIKTVGNADRGTMIEDFMNPKTFDDSSSEESFEIPPQPPVKRMLRNRGDSKPLPPLPPEAFGPVRRHSSRRPSFVPMTPTDETPRFDEEYPRTEDLFAGFTEDELSQAPQDNFLEAARAANDLYRQPYGDAEYDDDEGLDDDPPFEQIFVGIDNAAPKYRGIPDNTRPRADRELHRIYDNLEEREHRLSDAIIVDTFPHDAHTSWRATQRTDERTIHWGYDRFSKEVHGSAGGQDAAGCLMEKLERQMKGTGL